MTKIHGLVPGTTRISVSFRSTRDENVFWAWKGGKAAASYVLAEAWPGVAGAFVAPDGRRCRLVEVKGAGGEVVWTASPRDVRLAQEHRMAIEALPVNRRGDSYDAMRACEYFKLAME